MGGMVGSGIFSVLGLAIAQAGYAAFIAFTLGVAWNTAPRRGFSFAVGFLETMLRYWFSNNLALKADFQWDVRVYHLAADNPIVPRRYVRTEAMTPGFRFEYRPAPPLLLHAGTRWHVGRSQVLFDAQENRQSEDDIKSSWAIRVGVDYPLY